MLKNQPAQLDQQLASFRETLEDCHTILTKLGDRCQNVEEVVELIHLATTNQGQLTLLFDLLVPEK